MFTTVVTWVGIDFTLTKEDFIGNRIFRVRDHDYSVPYYFHIIKNALRTKELPL